MLDKIKTRLDKIASDVVFNEEEHSYLLKKDWRELVPVSNTLAFFNSDMANIPNIQKYIDRGNRVHKFLEKASKLNNLSFDTPELDFEMETTDFPFVEKGVDYLQKMKRKGWIVLSAEQLLYSIPDKIAGQVDLLLIRVPTVPALHKHKIHSQLYCQFKRTIGIKIVDWKTGSLRASHYAQIGLYKYLLEKCLKRLKLDIKYTTELVSLK